MGCFVLLTAWSSQTFFGRQERTNLETRLREKAAFINNFYAFLIADALMRKDDITLYQVINRLEEDQEISSILVTDKRGTLRYHQNPDKVGTISDDQQMMNALKTGEAAIVSYHNSGGKALALLTPLKVAGVNGPLGAIRIDLTYRYIEQQVTSSHKRFWFVIIGSMVTCASFVLLFTNQWILHPLRDLSKAIAGINAALPEPVLRETPDEFGEVAAAMNELLARIKNDLRQHLTQQKSRGDQEKAWIQQLAMTLLPGARVIVADKENRVVSDTGNAALATTKARPHLLDLIKDNAFATLLSGAFQKEGQASRGPVQFDGKPFTALILSVPAQQSVAVKTLIALMPQ